MLASVRLAARSALVDAYSGLAEKNNRPDIGERVATEIVKLWELDSFTGSVEIATHVW